MTAEVRDDDIYLGEIGRSVVRIETQLNKLADELRQELRDTRHRANDALTGIQLQRIKNEQYEDRLQRHDKSFDRMWPKIETLEKESASQEAVDRYRKWLVSAVGVLGSLGVLNLVINLLQSPPPR